MQVSHLHPKQQRLVAHHVLIHPDHGDGLEPGGVADQDTFPLFQDRVVGGIPRHGEAFGDTRSPPAPTADPGATASPAAPRPGWCPGATPARTRYTGSDGP